jgi:hypothetical protein
LHRGRTRPKGFLEQLIDLGPQRGQTLGKLGKRMEGTGSYDRTAVFQILPQCPCAIDPLSNRETQPRHDLSEMPAQFLLLGTSGQSE